MDTLLDSYDETSMVIGAHQHHKYLRKVCDAYCHLLMDSVDQAAATAAKTRTRCSGGGGGMDRVVEEAKVHGMLTLQRARSFVDTPSTRAACERVTEYLQGKTKSKQAFVIHGEHGAGKTAIMARLISTCRRLVGKDAVLITRFLGETSASSDVFSLLRSVAAQIVRAYGGNAEKEVPSEWKALLDKFPSLLSKASAEKPLCIFFDSLEQVRSFAPAPAHLLTHSPTI
jgi:hypothetical protein